MTSEDIKHQFIIISGRKATLKKKHSVRVQELCDSRGGRPWLPVPNKPYGFCGRKATLQQQVGCKAALEDEVRGGRDLKPRVVRGGYAKFEGVE